MIVAKLNGGLGNQMFQYAAAKALAVRLNTDLKLDISFFNIDPDNRWTKRFYELDVFTCKKNIVTEEELIPFLKICNANKYSKWLYTLSKYHCYREPFFHFTPVLFKQKINTCIEGYWQSEKYFKDIETIIHKEFEFVDIRLPLNNELADKIKKTESVSLHIRRTDYTNEIGIQYHGVCEISYYEKAIQLINEKFSNIELFIFSDDSEWTKKNLKFNFPSTYIDHNKDQNSYEDMRLMSLCKHNIIANSSFSWWAAWLNINPKKIVIAPNKWFNNKEKDTKDLIPVGWLKM